MKFLLLFLAIFGSLSAEISPAHKQTNDLNEDSEQVELDELIPDEVIKKCVDNRDRETYLKAKLARQRLTQCSSSLLHTDKLLQEVRAAVLSNGQGMGPIIKKFCKVYQTSGQLCLTDYLSDLAPCLNDTQAATEKLVVQMAETSWEYACQKDANVAMQFLKNDTLTCLEIQSPGIFQCIAPYMGRLRSAGDPTRAVAEVLIKKECSLYTSVTQCIVETLEKCEDQTAAQIVGGSFDKTLQISPCAGYVPIKEVTILQDEAPQQMATILQLEAAVLKLERIINKQQAQENIINNEILAALGQQTALLKQLTISLENVVPLIRHGRGWKYGRV